MRIPHNEPLGSGISNARPAGETAPERRCILTGSHGARDELIRLAISPPGPDGSCDVLPDVQARAPGRGAWIGVSRGDLETAITKGKLKGALARAFKGAALTIPADLPQRIETALTRTFTDRLGLEQRTGKLLTGSDRIAESARKGKVTWLAHAADAGQDGSRKLDQAWRVGEAAEGTNKRGTCLALDRAALSVALGRDNVVHLALTDRAAAERVGTALHRLLHFLGRDSAADETMRDRADPAAQTTI
jgi:uncharacterized protein